MSLSDAITKIYNKNWSFVNDFTVSIKPSEFLKSNTKWGEIESDLELNIISIDTPQLSNAPIETYMANRWFIHNGRDELFRFSITFRDQDNMRLYSTFSKMYYLTKHNYFKYVVFDIKLKKNLDRPSVFEIAHNGQSVEIFDFGDTIIDSVSPVQFNTTNEQIAEFTVQFKSASPKIT